MRLVPIKDIKAYAIYKKRPEKMFLFTEERPFLKFTGDREQGKFDDLRPYIYIKDENELVEADFSYEELRQMLVIKF